MYPYTVTDDRLGRNKKRKDDGKRIFPEIVSGNLVIMRFSVHLCQRRFLNEHSSISHHVFHAFVHPPLVSKSYAPRFCHVRTSPVSLRGYKVTKKNKNKREKKKEQEGRGPMRNRAWALSCLLALGM